MGWNAFAVPLVAGQSITLPQLNELYAALQERNSALPFPVTLDAGPNAAILASRWPTDMLSVNGVIMPWWNAVNSVWGAGYIDPSLVGTFEWGNPPPSPFAGVDPSILGNPWPDIRYWNAVRAAILSLTTIRIDLSPGVDTTLLTAALGGPFTVPPEPDYAAALADACEDLVSAEEAGSAATEALAQIIAFNSASSVNFSACNETQGIALIPSQPCYSAGYGILVTVVGGGANTVFPDLEFDFGGTSIVGSVPGANSYAPGESSANDTGGVEWTLTMPDMFDASALQDDFGAFGDLQASALIYMGGGDETAIGVQPTFSFV